MRRALLAAVLAAPALALGQVPAPGTVLFVEGASDYVHGPSIGVAECSASKSTPDDAVASVNLSWSMRLLSPGPHYDVTSQVFAATAPPAGDLCPAADSVSPQYRAGPVGPALLDRGTIVDLAQVRFGAIGLDCAAASADTLLYVCVQAFADGGGCGAGGASPLALLAVAALLARRRRAR